jgi:hypothetical protein
MNFVLRVFFFVGLLAQPCAHAEIGKTNQIDMMAGKPELPVHSLLLFQERPWGADSLGLLKKKLAFYKFAVDSGELIKRYPAIANKKIRIVILYAEQPDPASEAILKEFQSAFARDQIEVYWTSAKDAAATIDKPAESAVARWIAVARTDAITLHVDQATIRRAGDMAKMWILVDYRVPPAPLAGQRKYASQKMQHEYDCKEMQTRQVYGSWHSGNMGDGDVVATTATPGMWSPVSPRSAGEIQWKIACGK